jgi:hypothetical protein
VCGKPCLKIVGKLYYGPMLRGSANAYHSNYTHHADVGNCCEDKLLKGFQFRKRMTASEYHESRKVGVTKNWNSGRGRIKSDATMQSILGKVLVDNKDTEADSYRIQGDDWRLQRRLANRTPPGCHPALQVDIGDDIHLFICELGLWDEIERYILELETRVEQLTGEKGADTG